MQVIPVAPQSVSTVHARPTAVLLERRDEDPNESPSDPAHATPATNTITHQPIFLPDAMFRTSLLPWCRAAYLNG